jgi:hypothetical protein
MPFGVVRAVKCIGLAPACCELGERSAGARIRYAWLTVVLIWRQATACRLSGTQLMGFRDRQRMITLKGCDLRRACPTGHLAVKIIPGISREVGSFA